MAIVSPLHDVADAPPVVPLVLPPTTAPKASPIPTDGTGKGRGLQPECPTSRKPRNTRYQSLDLWRGVACLMLVCYHATFYADVHMRLSKPATWSCEGVLLQLIRQFWCGVPIFFVISGYCIAASIDSLRQRPHSLGEYFVRRFRRIYPPLWIMCAVAVVFSLAVSIFPTIYTRCLQLPRWTDFSPWQWIGNFMAAESWRHNILGGEPAYLMDNTWTLCYEEQFYLVTGLMLAVAPRRFFSLAALVTIGVLVLRFAFLAIGVSQPGFFWDGHWLLFAAGILVYYALNYRESRQRSWSLGMFLSGMIYGVAERFLAEDHFHRHLGEYLFVAGGFALLLVCLQRWDQAIAQHWSLAPLRWCGQRSYSIYLTHYPLVVTVSCVLALAGWTSELGVATVAVPLGLLISLPVAAGFHLLVERRFMNRPLETVR